MTLEELYHQSLEALPPILRGLCWVTRLSPEDMEDLRSDIHVKLLEDDYRVLRLWDGRSSLKGYLGTVVSNIWHDRVRGEKGRDRPSTAAMRLGPAAIELELLLGRQGLTLDQAYQTIKPRFPGLSRGEAEEIAAQINPKHSPIIENEDVVMQLPDLEPTGDELLEQREKLVKKRKALALMHRLLSELPEQDRILLVRSHAEGVKFSYIARSLGIDQPPLYRRNKRLLTKLKADLEEAGIRWEDLSKVLGIDEPPETGHARPARYLLSEDMVARRPAEDALLVQREDPVEKRKALALMHRLLSELPEQDRYLLRASDEGVKLSRIARDLGIDQRSLYRHYQGLLKKLRTDLEEAGIRWNDLSEVQGIDEPPETGPGEQGKFRVSATAKRLGPPGPELEVLLVQQGLTFDEAYEVIKPRFPGLSRSEAEEIVARLPYFARDFEEALLVPIEIEENLTLPTSWGPLVPGGLPEHTGFLGGMAVAETCVTPTDLAAFLEGSLTGEERDQMVRHLNHCQDCFERYIGAAQLLDAIEEEEASASE